MPQHETVSQPTPALPLVRQEVVETGSSYVANSPQGKAYAGEQAQNLPAAVLTSHASARAAEAQVQQVAPPIMLPPAARVDVNGHAFAAGAAHEESLDEVQAHRATKHQDATVSPRKQKELSWWLLLGGFLASAAIALGMTLILSVSVRNYNKLSALYVEQGQRLSSSHSQTDTAETSTTPQQAGQIPLSEVKDNTPVYARYTDLDALAQGKSASEISVSQELGSTAFGAPQWTLLKFHDRYFVRGWRFREDSKRKADAGWFGSIAADMDQQETSEMPIERFKELSTPSSVIFDDDKTGESVYLPESP